MNYFANNVAHIHETPFYFRCPSALSEKIYPQQFTGVTDSAGRIGTSLSADEVAIISARVVSPRNVAQYGVNITVNPSQPAWYLDCPVLANMQVTYECLIYKI